MGVNLPFFLKYIILPGLAGLIITVALTIFAINPLMTGNKCGHYPDMLIFADFSGQSNATPPVWNDAKRAKQFWNIIHKKPNNLVFFGAEGCGWCRAAKKWWNKNGAIDGWQFVEWDLMSSDNYESYMEFSKTVRDIFYSRNPEDKPVAYPTCAAIVGAQPDTPLDQSVKVSFSGFNKCTKILRAFVQSQKSK